MERASLPAIPSSPGNPVTSRSACQARPVPSQGDRRSVCRRRAAPRIRALSPGSTRSSASASSAEVKPDRDAGADVSTIRRWRGPRQAQATARDREASLPHRREPAVELDAPPPAWRAGNVARGFADNSPGAGAASSNRIGNCDVSTVLRSIQKSYQAVRL